MDKSTISENIIKARKEKGMSQEEMAFRMDIGLSTYKNFEEGKINLLSRHFEKFGEITGKTVEELILGHDAGQGLLNQDGFSEEKKRALIDEYEQRLKDKDDNIASLKQLVDLQKRHIDILDSINAKLEEQLSKID